LFHGTNHAAVSSQQREQYLKDKTSFNLIRNEYMKKQTARIKPFFGKHLEPNDEWTHARK
jgi:hypothetical protein